MSVCRLKLGIAGLGRGFMLMLPTLLRHPLIETVAAADPRPEARARFQQDFHGRAHASVAALCDDPQVQAVYIATPHALHLEHVTLAARAGKHVIVEKPMALTLADCRAMIDATTRAGVRLMVGHSHSHDAPYLLARRLIESGEVGSVRMITAMNFTDFVYRPRRPEELDTARGGGVVFSQAAHQVDIVRLLGGGRVRSLRAATGNWDKARPTEGAYAAFLTFADGAFATLTYSGYAHFDTDILHGWIGELGQQREPFRTGDARARLAAMRDPSEEAALKATRGYGAPGAAAAAGNAAPSAHNHFGLVIASCDRADLRPTPLGVEIHGDAAMRLEALPSPEVPRAEMFDEFHAAVLHGRPLAHSGEWGLATMEVCLAILQSAAEDREIELSQQCGVDLLSP